MDDKDCIQILISFMGYADKKKDIINKINSDVLPVLNRMGFQNVKILPLDSDFIYTKRGKTISFSDGVPKGICVKEGIQRAIDENDPKYIIFLDGSGKISPDTIIDFIEAFYDKKCDVILGERKGNKGITKERYSIEKFELFILEEKYNCNLPDGQCGCWAFKPFIDQHKRISLTAEDYSIELDLLSEILEKKLNFVFVPVKITVKDDENKPITYFKPENHETKIKFLAEKLSLRKFELIAYADHFNNNIEKLPREYLDMLKRMEIREPEKKSVDEWKRGTAE